MTTELAERRKGQALALLAAAAGLIAVAAVTVGIETRASRARRGRRNWWLSPTPIF